MSRRHVRLRVISVAAAISLAAAGCTSSSADGPSSTSTSTTASASVVDTATSPSVAAVSTPQVDPTPSVIDVPTPTPVPVTPSDVDSQETADRAAVEAQWIRYTDIYNNIVRTSQADRDPLAATVAIDPARTNLSKSAEYFESKGQDTYGAVVHRLSWLESINGASDAVLSDCQDQTQFGAIDLASGQKLTKGVERDNVKAHFVRGADGVWRVDNVYFLLDIPC